MANQMSLQDDNIFFLQIRHEKVLNKKNGIKQIKRRNARVCVVTQNNKLFIVNILR